MHNRVHPPGGIIVLWAARRLLGDGTVVAGLVRHVLAALCAVPVYYLGRQCYGRRAAVLCLALWLLAPALLIHGSLSVEGVYALPILASLWMFAAAVGTGRSRSLVFGALAGIALAAGALMTFSVSVVAVLLVLATAATYVVDRSHFSKALTALLITGATCLLCLLLLYVATGFDYLSSLRVALEEDRKVEDWKAVATLPYRLMVGLGNLTAFLLGVGLPTVCWWARALMAGRLRFPPGDPYRLALPLVLLVFAFGGFYSLETERIWLFLVPLVILPAGNLLDCWISNAGSYREWLFTGALLALQTIVFQLSLAIGTWLNWSWTLVR